VTRSGQIVPRVTTYRWAEIDGLRIFFREAGRGDAPTIVLLHGFPSSSRMYEPILPLLADRYHVIAPDFPGFGHSDAPPATSYDYTFDHLAQTIERLLITLNIERYALIMQDYGGPVGFRIALRNPNSVQAIIVQNANVYREGLGPKWQEIARYWEDPATHSDVLHRFTSLEGARQRHIGNSPHPDRYDPDTWTDEFAFLSRPGQREIQAALLLDYQTNPASYPDWQRWLRTQRPPALVLWGRYDPSFIVPGALAFARDVPDAEIHLLDAGHFALDEAKERVGELVLDFLGRRLISAR
jgi:pimeloyl-ACP methyl ester carboxylesterase